MASFAEKDVLIEFISYLVGITAFKVDHDNPNIVELLELKQELYSLPPEEIDYAEKIEFLKHKRSILSELIGDKI